MDAINGIDACRFAVYFIVIINGHGKGQIVFGAYLRQEAGSKTFSYPHRLAHGADELEAS